MAAAEPVYAITRIFAAPRDLVWRAWTETDLFAQWFGPKGVKVVVKTHDLRPGGMLHSSMTNPDGSMMWARLDYLEVEPPSRLSWVHGFSDEEAHRTESPFGGPFPREMLTTVVFKDLGDKTEITLTWVPIDPTDEERAAFIASMDSFDMGWGGSFEKLDEFLVGMG